MKETILTIIYFLFSTPGRIAFSQETDSCKVLLKEIVGIYRGDCKQGLADGKGFSKGEDSYQGMFKNGLPDGKGEYYYKNGDKFIGYWSRGFKNGEGKFIQSMQGKINTIKGFWENGNYKGPNKPDEQYRVTTSLGIENYSIEKVGEGSNQIEIEIISAMVRITPRDLKIETTSGQLLQEGKKISIYDFYPRNRCSILFTIKTSGGDKSCNLTFEILKPGKYKVVITHN